MSSVLMSSGRRKILAAERLEVCSSMSFHRALLWSVSARTGVPTSRRPQCVES